MQMGRRVGGQVLCLIHAWKEDERAGVGMFLYLQREMRLPRPRMRWTASETRRGATPHDPPVTHEKQSRWRGDARFGRPRVVCE